MDSWVAPFLHHVKDGLAVHGDVAQVPPIGTRQQREEHSCSERNQRYHHENESFVAPNLALFPTSDFRLRLTGEICVCQRFSFNLLDATGKESA